MKDAEGNLFVAATAAASFGTFNAERLHDVLEAARAIETLLHDHEPATSSR